MTKAILLKPLPYYVALCLLSISFTVGEAAKPGFADPTRPPCTGVHTWHTVTSIQGSWTGNLVPIHEEGIFLYPNCTEMASNATIVISAEANVTQQFGFRIPSGSNDDFNVGYTLSLFLQGSERNRAGPLARKLNFAATACVFVISAAAAANPDIRPNNYNGAVCYWETVDGMGENYFVNYNK